MKSIFIIFGLVVSAFGADYYVATNGTPLGTGSISQPWDIASGLADNTVSTNANHVVSAGDTIWLTSGTYGTGGAWFVRSKLRGTEASPIIVRQQSSSRAIIDGGISGEGEWTTFWGFEITNSSTNRYCTTEERPPGLNMLGRGCKAVNLMVYNTGHPGIGFWDAVGDGGEIYGCLFWGVGIYSQDPGWNGVERGSAIYAQNEIGDRLIEDSVSFRNWTSGFKVYAEEGYGNGFNLNGNVSFLNGYQGFHIETLTHPIDSLTLSSNISFADSTLTFGRDGVTNLTAQFNDNYVVNELDGSYQTLAYAASWENLNMQRNQFVFTGTNDTGLDAAQYFSIIRGGSTQIVNSNSYYGGHSNLINFRLHPYGKIEWGVMRGYTGWESNGIVTPNVTPAQDHIKLRPNRYERGRGLLSVINWTGATSISVDLTPLQLANGERFEVRDAQDPVGSALVTENFQSSSPEISFPLTNSSVAEVVGPHSHFTTKMGMHTGPEFNVFLILPMSRAGSATANSATVGRVAVR